jgi:hypothetical protein
MAVWGSLAGLSLLGCGTPAGDASLTLTASPRSISGTASTTLTVEATDGLAKPGTGKVVLTSTAGALMDDAVTLDATGKGTTQFSCDVALDTKCKGSVRLTATWTPANPKGAAAVETLLTVTVTAPAGPGDAGQDAGVADAGMTDAGMADAGRPDAGPMVDAGFTLTADRARIFMRVGDSSLLSATVIPPVAGADVDFSTTLGAVGDLDAGSTGAATYRAQTNAMGVAQARFTEAGAAGTATITAAGPMGRMANITVDVLTVQSVMHVSTTCAGSPCTIMGIRGSGFNESAQVRFRVVDSLSRGVPGILVTFSIVNPPTGTTTAPSGRTDMNGEVVANVSSGPTIGAFNVKATVIPGMVEADSPTIGIRGAKPSNNGFTLQCDRVNLAVYVSPTPPLPLTVNCRVTLVDRYGNPVGTGTTVRLNSEAGTVPSSVQTVAFMSTGSNPNEGQGTFSFNTVGPFPALDVPPLMANTTQYPFPRDLEPSRQVNSLEVNPRDGLVTLIAYVRGEEHFYDDNNNGVRDNNERFVDQGEPFVDKNDNNVWDPGEIYVDESPADGMWNPPNGVWDSNVTIWTVTHLLYTGMVDPSWSELTPVNFGLVPKGTATLLAGYLVDTRGNRLEGGASLGLIQTASKGSVTLENSGAGLDGYGFGLSARELVDSAGTGMCTGTTPICVFRTLFGGWSRGLITNVRVTGAGPTDTTASQGTVVTLTGAVRMNAASVTASGTIQ